MREPRFRAINKHGHMVFGFLSMNTAFDYVISEPFEHNPTMSDPCGGVDMEYHIIDEKTIGQFTGLTDKKGVDIYEGDIVNDNFIGIGQVKYNEHHAAFKILYKNNHTAKWFVDMFKNESRSIESIGNIHQHPELLTKG